MMPASRHNDIWRCSSLCSNAVLAPAESITRACKGSAAAAILKQTVGPAAATCAAAVNAEGTEIAR